MNKRELREAARALAETGIQITGSGAMHKPSWRILAGDRARKQIAAWQATRRQRSGLSRTATACTTEVTT